MAEAVENLIRVSRFAFQHSARGPFDPRTCQEEITARA